MAEEQFYTPLPRGKGIFIGGDNTREDTPSLHGLQSQIEVLNRKNVELDQRNIELVIKVADLQSANTELGIQVAELREDNVLKTKQIADLQT